MLENPLYGCYTQVISSRLVNIASGSGGNCSLLTLSGRNFLIDCGVSHRRMSAVLAEQGLKPQDIEAVLLTHLHSDHVSALPAWYRLSDLRFVATNYTLKSIVEHLGVKQEIGRRFFGFNPGEAYTSGDVLVKPFVVSHDAPETVGLVFESCDARFVYLTDVGEAESDFSAHCSGADLLFLEANHEPEMVLSSSYPTFLKRRILGPRGHLSNEQSLSFLTGLHELPKKVVFGHLSRNNNAPEKLEERIGEYGIAGDVSEIVIANQFDASKIDF